MINGIRFSSDQEGGAVSITKVKHFSFQVDNGYRNGSGNMTIEGTLFYETDDYAHESIPFMFHIPHKQCFELVRFALGADDETQTSKSP